MSVWISDEKLLIFGHSKIWATCENFVWQMDYRPRPLAKKFPYAYVAAPEQNKILSSSFYSKK